ncbi:hypothetical protein N9R71_00270 [Candidatus Poseidoniales archaeon]|jgi:hypothetical protein|nr:hypothetical protein [Candidatus Poseidoniales archaeon]MDB0004578.1 hypothetical protein [Candidatus Poseidoniaceae archaeon]MDB2322399.1 hypothetical protein [Candidatus Poseidoniales archaeon]MDB2623978.1 hypothetical protein [Candidatus Poseidoniales archaeon]
MIPLLLGTALTVGRLTVNAVAVGSVAGATYGMGRKYGRLICEKLDTLEDRLTTMLSTTTSE